MSYGRSNWWHAMVVSLGIVGIGQAAAAQRDDTQRIALNIEAGSVVDSLKALGAQTGLTVMVYSELGRGVMAPAVIGSYRPSEALDLILKPTKLRAEFLDNNTVAVVAGTSSMTIDSRSILDRIRLSQTDRAGDQGANSAKRDSQNSETSQENARLEEVVVTAQKREERLIDVPISIVALSADDLQNRKLTSLDDLQFAVPGMAVSSNGFANSIELRGVSNVLGVSPLVGMYIDEANVTNSGGVQINPNTYDLERVEVLRGPQGTLYGEGSAGGTIRFITKSPTLDRFDMTASVASLFTQEGAPGGRINTAINVPLIDHELGVRLVGTYDREGGWIDQPAAGLKDINGQDLTNVRIKSLWRPSAQFSASFMAELYRNDRSTGAGDDASGNFMQVFHLTTTPGVSEDHDLYNLTLTYEFPVVKLLSATSYFREKVVGKDIGYILSGPPGTPVYNLLLPSTLSNDHAWVEELRLSSVGSGPWQWTVGGIYRHYRDIAAQPSGYYYDLPGLPGTSLPASYGATLGDTLFKSWSVFGDINYKWRERFTLGFGVRSFHENQDYVSIIDYGSGPVETDQTGRFHSVDPRVYAQYKLTRDINIYTSAAKGFRSGGFNVDPTRPTFAPEDVRTYELGTKMSLWNGRLRADTAIFYTDYKDFVVSGFVNQSDLYAGYSNAGNARIKGVEWDLAWRPSDQWSVGINGDYIDTRFTKINATSTAYDAGDPLDFAPKYQMTSWAERDFVWNGRPVSMRLDYTRRGRETYRNRGQGLYSESDVINLLGYYMNLRWSESLSFNLFAQNLLNDRGLISPDNEASTRSRPRTYGVGFDCAFK